MKRGIGQGTMIALILLLLAVIVLLPFITRGAVFVQNYVDGGICQATVALSSFKVEKFCVDWVESPVSLKCPKEHVTLIKNKTIEVARINGDEFKKTTTDNPTRIVADQLYSCWKSLGSGQAVILNQLDNAVSPEGISSDYVTGCFICSELHFENFNEEIKLGDYLVLNKPLGSDLTYYQLFNSPEVICEDKYEPGCFSNLEKKFLTLSKDCGGKDCESCEPGDCRGLTSMQTIDPKKDYAVVSIRKRFDACQKDKQTSDAELSLITYILPVDELNTACDIFIS